MSMLQQFDVSFVNSDGGKIERVPSVEDREIRLAQAFHQTNQIRIMVRTEITKSTYDHIVAKLGHDLIIGHPFS